LILRKSFNANDLIFQTVEDGPNNSGRKKYSSAAQGDSDGALLRSGSGVASVAESRLPNLGGPITPAKLATRALTDYPTPPCTGPNRYAKRLRNPGNEPF